MGCSRNQSLIQEFKHCINVFSGKELDSFKEKSRTFYFTIYEKCGQPAAISFNGYTSRR